MRRHTNPEARAARLVRWYPAAWRARYEAEFVLLLADDLRDHPASVGRRLDVIAHGIWARLADCGLVGTTASASRRTRAALFALAILTGGFALVGMGVWSQLTIGWQWAAPADPATRAGMWLMSGALLGLLGLAALAAAVGIVLVVRQLTREPDAGLALRAAIAAIAGVVLYLGCQHFGAGWPGTGGHAWPGRDLVPGWIARPVWAATLWVTAYWAHPDALRAFPADELLWMVLSPLAWLVLLGSGLATARRLRLAPRARGVAIAIAAGAVALMVVFLAGAGSWVLSGGPGPRGLFAVGVVDGLALAVMAATLLGAAHLVHRVQRRPSQPVTG